MQVSLFAGCGGIELWSIDDAVTLMLYGERTGLDLGNPVENSLWHLIIQKVNVDEEHYSASLYGFSVSRPFNAQDVWRLKFPDEAFLRFWEEIAAKNYYGIEESDWIKELKAKYRPQPESENLPPWVSGDSGAPLSEPPEELMESEEPKAAGEVIGGLTVAEVREVFERHQPVADIVKALAEFEAIPEGGVQEKSEKTLRSKLGNLASKHGWAAGTGKGEDAIPNSQWLGLKPLLMPGKPGRKPKKEIAQHN